MYHQEDPGYQEYIASAPTTPPARTAYERSQNERILREQAEDMERLRRKEQSGSAWM